MSKFHINKHGIPAICKAQSGNCPLGGAEQHFNSKQEAQVYSDKQSEKKHGLLPSINDKEELEKIYSAKQEELIQEMVESIKYSNDKYDMPDTTNTEPYDVLRDYVKDMIRKHNGENVDLSKMNYDFEKEVHENKDMYQDHDGKYSYSAESAIEKDLEQAEEMHDFCEERKAEANSLYKKAENVDWAKYGKTQHEGVLDMLNYLNDTEEFFE